MTLPTTLSHLAELVPGRVRSTPWVHVDMLLRGRWRPMDPDDPTDLGKIEYALREEIEAQGWQWSTRLGEAEGQYMATIYPGERGKVLAYRKVADTPAFALALAVLAALEETTAEAASGRRS